LKPNFSRAKVFEVFVRPSSQKNFESTKFLKTSQNLLGPREKCLGRAGLVLQIFSPKSDNNFKSNFSKVKVGGSSAAIAMGHEADPWSNRPR
jgi:hypothetical protein